LEEWLIRIAGVEAVGFAPVGEATVCVQIGFARAIVVDLGGEDTIYVLKPLQLLIGPDDRGRLLRPLDQ